MAQQQTTTTTHETHYRQGSQPVTACHRQVAPMGSVLRAAADGARPKVPTGQTASNWRDVDCPKCLHNRWWYAGGKCVIAFDR